MKNKVQLAKTLSDTIRATLSLYPWLSRDLKLCKHEGRDTYIDVEYEGLSYRLEVRGPL